MSNLHLMGGACRPRNPFRKGDGWLAWGVLGVAWAPVVVGLTAVAAAAVGYDVSLCLTSPGDVQPCHALC